MQAAAGADRLAARLATALAAPTRIIPPAAHLDPGLVQQLGKAPPGIRMLDRALARALGLQGGQLAANFPNRIATEENLRLSVRLVLAPENTAIALLRQLAGAINQMRVRAALLKADRRALESLLGPDVMQAALRPAPAFAPLAALADPALPVLRAAEGETPPPLRSQPLFRQATALAGALVAAQEPLLGRLWAARVLADTPAAPPANPAPPQAAAAWRLLAPRLTE